MTTNRNRWPIFAMFGATLVILMVFSLACAAAEPTPTPIPPAPPAPPAAPTPAPTPTATPAPRAPTPILLVPTPTKVLPTPTPVVTGKPRIGGVLREGIGSTVGATQFFQTLLPGYAISYNAREVFDVVNDTLVTQDPQLRYLPGLAESWSVGADGKTLAFRLRKDVKFHDGSPFNARVVKWNIDLNLDRENAPILDPVLSKTKPTTDLVPYVTKLEVVDDYTVAFYLKQPLRPFLAWLADNRAFAILSPQAAAKYPGKLGTTLVGTGPFRLVDWKQDQSLTVERSDSYWGGKSYLDGIKFIMIPEPQVHVAMLRTGELDLAYIRATFVPQVKGNPNLKIDQYESPAHDLLQFRIAKPPWDNKALRQAIGYAIDRQAYINSLYSGLGRPLYTSEGEGLWWSAPDLKPYTLDLDKARQKLVEAGYPKGLEVEMGCQSSASGLATCEVIQAMVAKIGIDVKVKPTPTLFADTMEGKVRFRVAPGWTVYGDPDVALRWMYYSYGDKNIRNDYRNPTIDRLLDEAAAIYDQAKAKEVYKEIMRIGNDDAVWITIMGYQSFAAMQSYVQGHQWYPDEYIRHRTIWLER